MAWKRLFVALGIWVFTEGFLSILLFLAHKALHYEDNTHLILHFITAGITACFTWYLEGIIHKLDTNQSIFLEMKRNFDYYQTEEKLFLQELGCVIRQAYPTEISNKLTAIEREQCGDINGFLQQYFKSWKDKINCSPKWRLIFQRFIHANKESIVSNKFSLTLETYLCSLWDIIDVMMEEANAKKLA